MPKQGLREKAHPHTPCITLSHKSVCRGLVSRVSQMWVSVCGVWGVFAPLHPSSIINNLSNAYQYLSLSLSGSPLLSLFWATSFISQIFAAHCRVNPNLPPPNKQPLRLSLSHKQRIDFSGAHSERWPHSKPPSLGSSSPFHTHIHLGGYRLINYWGFNCLVCASLSLFLISQGRITEAWIFFLFPCVCIISNLILAAPYQLPAPHTPSQLHVLILISENVGYGSVGGGVCVTQREPYISSSSNAIHNLA